MIIRFFIPVYSYIRLRFQIELTEQMIKATGLSGKLFGCRSTFLRSRSVALHHYSDLIKTVTQLFNPVFLYFGSCRDRRNYLINLLCFL